MRAWQGACVAGACVAGGHVWQRGHAWQGACVAGMPPPQQISTTRYGDRVNERAVRIPLECILVLQDGSIDGLGEERKGFSTREYCMTSARQNILMIFYEEIFCTRM